MSVGTAGGEERPPVADDCRREIVELHRFFQDWFNGELDADAFSRFAAVVAEGFVLIGPEGRLRERDELLDSVRAGRGKRAGGDAGIRIWIDEVRVRHSADGLLLATYHEWQEAEGAARGRLSSVLFRRREGTPNGLEWLHVHEVWLPSDDG